MKFYGALLFILCGFAASGRAAEVNLATLTCVRYQNEIIAAPAASRGADSINTVMWLFGYSVGKSGAHVMYGDALAGFGFALDAECKNNPAESLLDALATIKPDSKNPMDLSVLECQTFASRHLELGQSDRESADTIMMWLFGFAVAKSGSHVFNPGGLAGFEGTLMGDCKKNPGRSLADALSAIKFPVSKP
ncbi:MAG TPA: HdeA/HdeB family chaperone [Steroidobacteraceae bacterium]|nr:HdeA/HdeB family chaperone [Steroidobacteraceae bacterium]